jgi:glycosyltransferase involved in cell wall biosynthesis
MNKISVCIATYNGEKYIYAQLLSIIDQLLANDEIIISDDSSTDGTLKIIESFNDNRIRIFRGQKFKSPIFNFENAIKQSTGNYIFLADQDDVWLPGRVQKTIDLLTIDNCKMVLLNGYIVDENLNLLKGTLFDDRKPSRSVFKNIIKNSYTGCCMAFTADIKKFILPFPKNIPMHDQWIGLVCGFFFNTGFITEPLLYYRRHDSNASFTGGKSNFNIFTQLTFRIRVLYALLKRILCIKFVGLRLEKKVINKN